jgi:hypothetical protein
MNPIAKFFKKIDAVLNACVDYYDYRIRTGKFFEDINNYANVTKNSFKEQGNKEYEQVKKSGLTFVLLSLLRGLWQMFLKIPLLATIVSFIAETIRIVVTCYTEIFFIFAFTFPLTILLLNWFQTAIVAFFIGLIPILLLNIYCISALYLFIKHKEEGEHITLWHSFYILVPRFRTFIFPALTESAIIQESFFGFIIISLFLSYAFELFHIYWENSFIYWFIVLFIGFLLAVGIFIFTILMYQTFFTILLENVTFRQAFKRSRTVVSSFVTYYFFFYLLSIISFAYIIWKAVVAYLYLGLTIGLYAACVVITFMAFLLWKKFHSQQLQAVETTAYKPPLLFIIIIFFGFVNYLLLAVFIIKEYQPLISFVQQQEDSFLASQEMKQYTNTTYNYAIQYPRAWTVYQWSNKSTTFYNNYTGTISGGTWMSINVATYDPSIFEPLFTSAPGVVLVVGATKDVTTKVTNMSIQGYDTVNYTLVKYQVPYSQYETHYLIHKGNLMYDIAFISVTNDVASYDSDLFQRLINSFQFTQ